MHSPTWLDMLKRMYTIRFFEETLRESFTAGKIPGFVHLYSGQEAVAVGVCSLLNDDDYIFTTHRGHGHCIAKGIDLDRMMAEIYGRASGYCKGKAGSMHVAAFDKGVLGATGIVGAGLPLALGAAFAARVFGRGQVAAVFFGDGASNEGTFHESLNMASLWKLPLLFVCENNGYAQFTPQSQQAANLHISQRASSYAMPGVTVDGNDVLAVHAEALTAVERARKGQGPTLIECLTYRWHGHYVGDPEAYRSKEEVEQWKTKDPIERFAHYLEEQGSLSTEARETIVAEVKHRIKAAVEFAEHSPLPPSETALQEVYY